MIQNFQNSSQQTRSLLGNFFSLLHAISSPILIFSITFTTISAISKNHPVIASEKQPQKKRRPLLICYNNDSSIFSLWLSSFNSRFWIITSVSRTPLAYPIYSCTFSKNTHKNSAHMVHSQQSHLHPEQDFFSSNKT